MSSADAAASTSKSTVPMSPNEMFESLTGFDDIALDNAFGVNWRQDSDRNPAVFLRALAFAHFRRENEAAGGKTKDADAKQRALSLTTKQAYDFFEDEALDGDDDEPVTEQGKDGTPAE